MNIEDLKRRKKELKITFEELSAKTDIAVSTLKEIFRGATKSPRIDTLEAIEKALQIDSDEERIRSIGGFSLPPQHSIKIYGEVVCGKPVEAWQTDEGYVSIDYPNPEEYFGLRVKGDSMINVGIRPNSILIVHKQEWAENGDIVVACINGESTTKRYKKQGDIIFLMPENNRYEPIIVTEKDVFRIFGKVVECKVRF